MTHGLSGLVLAYAAVAIPMAVTLVRRTGDYGKAVGSWSLAVPVTVAAGITATIASPLIHGIGVTADSLLETAVGVGICAGFGYARARMASRPDRPRSVHQRGTLIQESPRGTPPSDRRTSGPHSSAQRQTDRSREAVTLAGLPVAPLDETKHFKLIGTTGTGKSTAIRELLTGALDRGDRAIIADPDGGYRSRFKDTSRGDIVLNPFESESLKWDLFGEINNPYDVDQLARSLLPDQGGPDRSWISYARTFFGSVTRQAHEAGITDIRELYRLLVVAEAKELRGLLAGTPAQPFLEEHNGRMFDSIRSITSSAVGSLDYIAQQTADPLSIRQWVRAGRAMHAEDRCHGGVSNAKRTGVLHDGGAVRPDGDQRAGGVLFIPYKAGQIAALRSTISAWMRLAIFETMSQPEGDQRLWFVVDELDALGQIDGLKDALARLRKFGGRCVLGFQSIAQVSSTYGKSDAQTITENCGNSLILRCSGSDPGGTANFASRLIGQREVLRTNRSQSRRPGEHFSSTTLSEHIGIEPAVMDSQIEQLPDLSGYLKFASEPNWQRVTLSAPDASDGAQTRQEARHFWQHWRSNHAPEPATTGRATNAANASAANANAANARANNSSDVATNPSASRATPPHVLPPTRDSLDHE